jgi:hypothetical protein
MNIGFVYKGVLVLFDEKIGYFIYVDGCRVSNNDKHLENFRLYLRTKLIKL